MDSLASRIKILLKALIRLFPAGHNWLLKREVDGYGIKYRGVFESYSIADQSKRSDTPYDDLNRGKSERLDSGDEDLDSWFSKDDYALVYWLQRLMTEQTRVLELGGSLGHFFYSAQKYLPLASTLPWQIAELPEAVKLGSTIASARKQYNLSFIDSASLGLAQTSDVFVTSGTIQYIESDLPHLLSTLKRKPNHVLVHQLPIHETHDYWTLQDLQQCEVPYRVYCAASLIAGMTEMGYTLRDQWYKDRRVCIPHHPELQVDKYAGFYFSLEEAQ